MQKLHVLTRVPEHVIDTPRHIVDQQRWHRRYNVASWIRFEVQDDSPVRLILRFKDASGVRDQAVDQANINNRTLLLSGVANLKLTGKIERMEVLIQCGSEHFSIDELFVQPINESVSVKSKLQKMSE